MGDKEQGDRVEKHSPSKNNTTPGPSPSTADAQDTSGYKTASPLALDLEVAKHNYTHARTCASDLVSVVPRSDVHPCDAPSSVRRSADASSCNGPRPASEVE